tara:strand:- start:19866 stop:20165 length:300 start_codon:yes stop_codon:yes gene_type:complete
MSKSKNESFIDGLLENLDNPIVMETGAFGYLGFIESLILNSLYAHTYQNHLLSKIDTMRKNEMDLLCVVLKENQRINDPQNQFKQMAKAGVFTSFADQN